MRKCRVRLAGKDDEDRLGKLYGVFFPEDRTGGTMKMRRDLSWDPPVDLIETDEELIVLMEIPGMEGKEIDVATDGEVLKIRGYRKSQHPQGKVVFHHIEIQVGRFERIIKLPVEIDPAQINARYDGGMLHVRSRKVKRAPRVRRIEIE